MKQWISILCAAILGCFLLISCGEIESLTLTGETKLIMKTGDVLDDDSVVCEITPGTSSDGDVRWVSSDETVVKIQTSVEQDRYLGKSFCRIEAVDLGKAEIHAESADGQVKSGSVTVTVTKDGREPDLNKLGKKDKDIPKIEDYIDENGVVRFDAPDGSDRDARKQLMVYEDVSYHDLMMAVEHYIDTRRLWGNPMGTGYGSETRDSTGDPTLIVDGHIVTLKGTLSTVNEVKVVQKCKFEIWVTFNDNFSDFTVDKFSTNMPELFTDEEMHDIT